MNKLIKVCGMRDPDNIRDLIRISPDLLGLIFYPQSSRFVSHPQELTKIFSQARNFKLVGVFVNEKKEAILQLHEFLNFDFIQLHGSESPEYCHDLKSHDIGIIKAFGIKSKDDFHLTATYQAIADYFLFDTKTTAYGGSGQKFDWKLLESYKGSTPFLLSGGIRPGDYPQINHPNFIGVDINSRFEVSPGIKDISLVSEYIKQLKK